jgi:polar amino acid transport system substrate-binding protein
MMSQMEQFCHQYNLSHQRTTNVLHVIDESLAILGSGGRVISPNTVLTLSYTERDDSLQLSIKSQQAISSGAFDAERDDLAVTILRNFCRDITIDGNNLRIDIK